MGRWGDGEMGRKRIYAYACYLLLPPTPPPPPTLPTLPPLPTPPPPPTLPTLPKLPIFAMFNIRVEITQIKERELDQKQSHRYVPSRRLRQFPHSC